MTRGLSYDQLAERLIRDDKNILILDTCCLLDIIRCVPRGQMEVYDSALNISNAIKERTLDFSIVLPSLVPKEWNDNIDTVTLEIKRFIKDQFNSLEVTRKVVAEISPDMTFNFGAFSQLEIEQELKAISRRIMDNGYICEKGDEISALAANRVVSDTPPSKKGKESLKDCIIYEEVLHIAELLRSTNFDKRIIFASSNTREYYENRSLCQSIEKELSERDIIFASSLNGAESEATKYNL